MVSLAITSRTFSRLGISAAVGSIVATVTHLGVVAAMGEFNHSHMTLGFLVQTLLLYLLPVTLLAALIGAVTYRKLSKPVAYAECRCRRCGYILKGISKLECPECGEVI